MATVTTPNDDFVRIKQVEWVSEDEFINSTDKQKYLNKVLLLQNHLQLKAPDDLTCIYNSKASYYCIVLTKAIILLIKEADGNISAAKHGKIDDFARNRLLRGSGGVGKSLLLFVLAQYYFLHGWLVLFINETDQLNVEHVIQKKVSDFFTQNKALLQRFELVEYLHRELQNTSGFKKLETLFYALVLKVNEEENGKRFPLAVLFDLYNLLPDVAPQSNVCKFKAFHVNTYVYFVAAETSQVKPINKIVFADAMLQNASIIVRCYEDDALHAHVSLLCELLNRNQNISKTEYQQLLVETGKVPKFVDWYIKSENFESNMLLYFLSRLESLHKKTGQTASYSSIAASLYLNKSVNECRELIDCGLLVRNNVAYEPVCPCAKRAFIAHCKYNDLI